MQFKAVYEGSISTKMCGTHKSQIGEQLWTKRGKWEPKRIIMQLVFLKMHRKRTYALGIISNILWDFIEYGGYNYFLFSKW